MARLATRDPCGYTLDVVAADTTDAVHAAGGLMFDRMREGWTVRVFVLDDLHPRPLQILGADCAYYDGSDGVAPWSSRTALAVSSTAVARRDAVHDDTLARIRRGRAEITLWGDPPADMRPHLMAIEHRLTAAARAFKASAQMACPTEGSAIGDAERFYGLGTLCVPGNPDLTPVTIAVG
ncbi:hypothetical protein A5764_20130 [Mycobacterium sp. 852002-51057_SCH5723018]|nr:hypothetical protein A5764_20130 [Mycobacterium sp. 852002-51057_SCH5723018]